MISKKVLFFFLLASLAIFNGCVQPFPQKNTWVLDTTPIVNPMKSVGTPTVTPTAQRTPFVIPTRELGKPMYSPTPDNPKIFPTLRSEDVIYTVQWNDALNLISRRYGVDMNSIIVTNQLADPNLLEVGQILVIPPPDPSNKAPAFKIVPDSELVFGPSGIGFDSYQFIYSHDGYLSSLDHSDEVVLQVALDYSINPRILLSVLEYATGWVTGPNIIPENSATPQEPVKDAWESGLFSMLSRISMSLNYGYYSWKENDLSYYVLSDGSYFPADETINAGTAAVQYWASTLYGKDKWLQAISENGIYRTYFEFFRFPFDYTYDPLVPEDLQQPDLILPFQPGVAWSFTGGPHAGWDFGSAWAALDFAPPGSPMGCVVSIDWATAVADGLILRSDQGTVIQDLDGDGYEQTGWVILYMHSDYWERVQAGKYVNAGDFIGHPSCEGGVSTGTHLHIARKFNGEWIRADGSSPFVMSGFVPKSNGLEYDGTLIGNGVFIEASEFFRLESLIYR